MPTLKRTLLNRTRQLYAAVIIPIFIFIFVIYMLIGTQTFHAERGRMAAVTDLYMMKISEIFHEIEELFNPVLNDLLIEEYNTGYDSNAISHIKNSLSNLDYDTLEIDSINYYRFDASNRIYDTDFEPDLGRSFPNWSFFNQTVRDSEPGTVFLKPLARESETGLVRLYAYVNMPNDEIFEIGIRFKDMHDIIKSLGVEVFDNSLADVRIFEEFDEEEKFYLDDAYEAGKTIFRLFSPWKAAYYISRDYKYGRYDVVVDIDVIFINFIILSVVVLIIILMGLAYLVNKIVSRLSNSLTQPILNLEDNMKQFSVNQTETNNKTIQSDIFELESMYQSFIAMKEAIVNSYDEMNAMNEELEESYQENQILIEKIETLIEIPDFLMYLNNMEVFLKKSFEKLNSLISDADAAFVSIVENGQYKYLDSKGIELALLNAQKMKVDAYYHSETLSFYEYDENEFILQGHNIPQINAYTKHIRQMISIPIKSKDLLIGVIALSTNTSGKLTEDDFKIAKFFSDYIQGYLIIHELTTLEKDVQKATVFGIIKLLEKHDSYTKGHSESVAKLAMAFAEFLELDEKTVQDIYWAGLVHDIGKIIIPNTILNKPSRLTEEEFEVIKQHPKYAYEALRENKHMDGIAKTIRHHHERYDGKGYPDKLSGKDIPYTSRILTLADSWDAMTAERVYKKGMSTEDALQEIKKHSGKQFDPELVKKWQLFVEKQS